MSTKVLVIEAGRCKSCGRCVELCPKKTLAIGKEINEQGYNYVTQIHPENCVRCNTCGLVCPDIAIGVANTFAKPFVHTIVKKQA